MYKFRFLLATILMVATSSFCFSQTNRQSPDKKFSPEELRMDLFQLRTILENVHPGLYRFESKETWDRRFDSLSASFTNPISDIEFYRILARVLSQVRCGHTHINVSSYYQQQVFQDSKNFPFMVRILDRKLYSYHNLSDENNIPDGSEIIRINQLSKDSIFRIFYPTIQADGFIETARYKKMGKYFSYLYALLIGYPEAFQIEYISPGSKKISQAAVKAKKDLEKGSLHWERYDSKVPETPLMKSPLAAVIDKKKDYCVLKIDRFFTREGEPKDLFEKFYDSLFTQISKQNIGHLIIDLRGNGGGIDDLPSLLYSYLTNTPFTWYRRMQVKNLNYSSYTSNYTYNQYQYVQDKDGNTWVSNGDFLLRPHPTSSPTFNGKVWVLTDGLTFSAAAILAAYIQSAGRGKIIGEETGGYSNAVTGGRTVNFSLVHTGIQFSIPPLQTFFELDSPDQNRGVIPDYPIQPGILDLVKEKDPVMEFAIQKAKDRPLH